MDPWQVLGIDAASTYEEASSAYRVRLQLRHPDRHHGSSHAVLDEAARETRELNEAWDLVKAQIQSRHEPKEAPLSQSHEDTLAAHQMSLEVARTQLELNKAYLERAISEGGSIRISRLREAIAFSEKMVIAAESAVRCGIAGGSVEGVE